MKWLQGFGKPAAGSKEETTTEPYDNFVPPPPLAVEIDGNDIQLIERIEEFGRFSSTLPSTPLTKRLYMRVGAAKALGEVGRGVPLLLSEIDDELERMVHPLGSMARVPAGLADEAKQLMRRLYVQAGEAQVAYEIGGQKVWTLSGDHLAIEG